MSASASFCLLPLPTRALRCVCACACVCVVTLGSVLDLQNNYLGGALPTLSPLTLLTYVPCGDFRDIESCLFVRVSVWYSLARFTA